jgi:hypothetical protein
MKGRIRVTACAGLVTAVFAAPAVSGEQTNAHEEIQRLRQEVEAQRRQLEAQQRRLEQLEAQIGRVVQTAPPAVIRTAEPAAQPPAQPVQPPTAPVGQAPDTTRPPEVPALTDIRGVLTPPKTLVLEPSLQYSHSSSNRVALLGFTVIPAITIGLIDVRSVRRDTFIAALAARYGVTNRFEVEARVPYVWREDATISRPFATPQATDATFEASGKNIGDIEVIGRYQLNFPGPNRPYYVAGLRLKTRTGKGPFEVETEQQNAAFLGLERQLPTGSGFYGLQPSLTVIYPSDPAVFFGNVNYLWNMKRTVGGGFGTIDPGDSVGFTLGMGLALNENASFSIGYDHATVFRTRQDGALIQNTTRVQIGSLLFGLSYRLTPRTNLNFTLGAGLTQEAPNVQLTLRLPMTM